MTHEVIVRFSTPTEAQAVDLVAQVAARMTNATVAGIGTPGARTSYYRHTDNDALVSMGYVDEFGIVRTGEYIAPDPYPVWVQPIGAQDSYPVLRLDGEPTRVMFESEAWQNTAGVVNSWAPGVFGWTRVADL